MVNSCHCLKMRSMPLFNLGPTPTTLALSFVSDPKPKDVNVSGYPSSSSPAHRPFAANRGTVLSRAKIFCLELSLAKNACVLVWFSGQYCQLAFSGCPLNTAPIAAKVGLPCLLVRWDVFLKTVRTLKSPVSINGANHPGNRSIDCAMRQHAFV